MGFTDSESMHMSYLLYRSAEAIYNMMDKGKTTRNELEEVFTKLLKGYQQKVAFSYLFQCFKV